MSFRVLSRGLMSRGGSSVMATTTTSRSTGFVVSQHWKTINATTTANTAWWNNNTTTNPNNSLIALTSVRTFASKKKKNLLRHTKGFRGRSKNCFRVAIRRLQKSWQYAFRDRRRKRREWSKLWIQRISAGARQYNYSYSRFMGDLNRCRGGDVGGGGYTVANSSTTMPIILLDRKVLAELAANEPFAFRSVVQVVEHLSSSSRKTKSM